MIFRLLILSCLLVLAGSPLLAQRFEPVDASGLKWFKGNLHTHTKAGGAGDSSSEVVAAWYKTHGYNFLAITDHYVITLPRGPEEIVDAGFILIRGEEATAYAKTDDVDVGALGIESPIAALRRKSISECLQTAIDAVRAAGGVPVINHPNDNWRLSAALIEGTSDCSLFELYNGGPTTNSFGDASHPDTEHMWDSVLSSGKRIYGIATDDANHFYAFSPDKWNPGRGWVVVRARSLSPHDILHSLEHGLFYSSTGIVLEDIVVDADKLQVQIQADAKYAYATEFIGSGGKVIYRTNEKSAIFILKGQRGYVRARVIDSGGHMAWIQPSFISGED